MQQSITQFRKIKRLGKGSFGEVSEYIDKSTGQTVAIKQIDTSDMKTAQIIALTSEFALNQLLHHQNIVQMFSQFGEDQQDSGQSTYYVVMEKADLNLAQLIKQWQQKQLWQSTCQSTINSCCSQISSGLAFIHSRNIVHRDIKPENILVFITNNVSTFKIGDFGIAKQIQSKASTMIGTKNYMAPELFSKSPCYNQFVDIWSMGCVFIEVLTGSMAFADMSYPDDDIKNCNFNWNLILDEQIKCLIKSMLSLIPEKRPSATYVSDCFTCNQQLSNKQITAQLIEYYLPDQNSQPKCEEQNLIMKEDDENTMNQEYQQKDIDDNNRFAQIINENMRKPAERILESKQKLESDQSSDYQKFAEDYLKQSQLKLKIIEDIKQTVEGKSTRSMYLNGKVKRGTKIQFHCPIKKALNLQPCAVDNNKDNIDSILACDIECVQPHELCSGTGIMFYLQNKNYYVGEILNNREHGFGWLYSQDHTLIYSGFWKKGQFNRFGEYYYNESGNIYCGEWKSGQQCGKGIYYYGNGVRIEGEFDDDSCVGVIILRNGVRVNCKLEFDDVETGVGTATLLSNGLEIKFNSESSHSK